MSDVCPKCGLNKELCVCETIAKKEQQISITVIKRKFGKLITIVQGLDTKDIDIRDLAKKLKTTLACGGTSKGGVIELQGDHAIKAKAALIRFGFQKDTIKTN